MKLKYIALILILIDILSIDKGNSGGHLAHLGGALWGYIFATSLKKGKDYSKLPVFINFTKKPKMKVHTNNTYKTKTDEAYNKMKQARQARIDYILEKISKSGYESLSTEEKELLFDVSNRSK